MNIRDKKIKTELMVAIECVKNIEINNLDYVTTTNKIQAITILECLINLIDWED